MENTQKGLIKTTDEQELFFRIAMWWRIGYGLIRLILGFVLLKVVGKPISDVFYNLMNHELSQDPNDILIQTISPHLQHLPITITYFVAFYFIFWGLLDVLLSIQLLKHKLWAFPLTIALISLFVLYELYRFSHTHSLILLGVIFVDMVVVALIHKEYRSKIILTQGNNETDSP